MQLKYRIYGEQQQTLVLLHYFGGKGESWHWVVKRLKKRFRIVVITLPGFGGTNPLSQLSIYHFSKYINNCLDELVLKDYVLCGHSMSGKLVLYATQINTGVRPLALVLIAPSPPTIEKMPAEEKKRMLNHPNKIEAIKTVCKASNKKLKGPKFDLAVQSQLEVEPETWKWWLIDGMSDNIADRIQGIEIPTFVICSKKDPVISIDSIYKEVMPYLYQPRLVQFGRSGHLLPLESPRKLSRKLKKIAKSVF